MGWDLMKIKGTGNDQWYDGRRNWWSSQL